MRNFVLSETVLLLLSVRKNMKEPFVSIATSLPHREEYADAASPYCDTAS